MQLDLTDDEAAALTEELHEIVENDRYPFSLSRSHLRCSPRIPHAEGDPRQAQAGAGSRAPAAAEGVWATE